MPAGYIQLEILLLQGLHILLLLWAPWLFSRYEELGIFEFRFGAIQLSSVVSGAMSVQGGIGPAGHSTDDLYVLDLTNDKFKWHR